MNVLVTQRRNLKRINGVAQCCSHGESMNHPQPPWNDFLQPKGFSWIGKCYMKNVKMFAQQRHKNPAEL